MKGLEVLPSLQLEQVGHWGTVTARLGSDVNLVPKKVTVFPQLCFARMAQGVTAGVFTQAISGGSAA